MLPAERGKMDAIFGGKPVLSKENLDVLVGMIARAPVQNYAESTQLKPHVDAFVQLHDLVKRGAIVTLVTPEEMKSLEAAREAASKNPNPPQNVGRAVKKALAEPIK
jgi:hypothetical protein